jgi:predicted peptidase
MTFYLYLPRNYDPHQQYPLVLVLHGGGERALPNRSPTQNTSVLLTDEYVAIWGNGFPTNGPSVQKNWPSFIVAPQIMGGGRWVNVPASAAPYQLLAQPSQSLLMAVEIVELLQQEYTAIDSARLYVTGLSMGGFGVWEAIERWPSLFAAAVPIAGAGDPAFAARIASVPIWDFHGAKDAIVPVAGSRTMVAALRAAGGHPCYTEYAAQGHGIWEQVYGLAQNPRNPLYPWLFSQRLGGGSSAGPPCG